jgi:AcrR family transcriptional regulator
MAPFTVKAYDRAAEHLLARIAAGCEREARWPARLLRGCEESASFLGEDPERARLLTGGILLLPGGLDRHRASVERLADLLHTARSYYPGAKELPGDTERVLAEGLCATLGARLAGEAVGPQLPFPADLAELALAPYAGAAQARDSIEAELGRRRGGPKTLAGLRLPPAVAAADQRRRILAATIEEVLERGLGRASVLRIAGRAEISKATFYEHFPNKREALLAAYEDAEARLRARVFDRGAEESDWPEQVRAAVAAALRFFAAEPGTLLLLTREGAAADERVAERNRASLRILADRLRQGRSLSSAELPDVTEQTVLESAAAMLRERVLVDEVASLPRLAPRLTELLLTPYLGTEQARRVAAASG